MMRNRRARGLSAAVISGVLALLPAAALHGASGAGTAPLVDLSRYLLDPPSDYASLAGRTRRPQDPFPLSTHERALLFAPYQPGLRKHTMGWTLRNRLHCRSVPAEAREVPEDVSTLPLLRFDNLEVHGERELRWRTHGAYDQWFLHDETRHIHAVMAVHRASKRVYLFEYRRQGPMLRFGKSIDNCFSCHPSGPRLIRTYRLPNVDPKLLNEVNARLLSYGALDFGPAVDPARLGPALEDGRCTGCHNGATRGRLYPIHLRTIRYYLRELHAMPPGAPLSPSESDRLMRKLYDGWHSSLAASPEHR